ncbi:MAG: hypothetical protein JWM33_1226 [Caulobacteraceae bacterium]|nr:hypothetical protein [Caulobacteraceae bacterium]
MSVSPERALRRMVSELASCRPEDIEMILDGLALPQRARVAALLTECINGGLPGSPVPKPQPKDRLSNLAGLSPWLTVRLDRVTMPGGAASDPMSQAMTPAAFAALELAASSIRDTVSASSDDRALSRPASGALGQSPVS